MSCRHYSIGAPRLAAIAGVALLLAGCSTTGVRYLASEAPTDYRQRHPISLKEGQRTVRLFVGSNRGGLTPAQRADVTSFAMAWKRESTSGIVVDVPKGTSNGRAARDSLREIHSILTAAGVPKTGVFVGLAGQETVNISLQANDLTSAREAVHMSEGVPKETIRD